MKTKSIFLAILFVTIATTTQAANLKIMTYNTLNLFDTKHDTGKHDYTYLPKSKKSSSEVQNYCKSKRGHRKNECLNLDWNSSVLKSKVLELAKVIKEANPDVIVFEEVENKNVLNILVKTGLNGLGYNNVILIEGQDTRGIDVGMISKIKPFKTPSYHPIDLKGIPNKGRKNKLTRGILEVNFKINNKVVTVLGNHWPSQGNSDECRMKAGEVLYNAINPSDDIIIATGDFNTSREDKLNGINEYLLNSNRKFTFIDSEIEHFSKFRNSSVHKGTYFFGGRWGTLDKIFILNNSRDIKPLWSSYNVISKSYMINKNGPIRFNPRTKKGFSDHLPALINIEIN